MGNGIQKLEENHYYPFGLKHKKYNSYQYVFVALNEIDGYDLGIDPLPESGRDEYQYKYIGQEWQDELGLNVYDFDNRVYDPAIARFWEMDPLAEQGRRWSPYNYCFDNPMYFRDPDGMWPDNPFKGLVKAVKQTVKSEYREVKNAVKSALNKLEKFEKSLGGYDFQSDLKSPSDKSDTQQKRNGRNVEKVDVTGFDAASGLSGAKGKGDGKTDATKLVTSATKEAKAVVEKFKDGMDTAKMVDAAKDVAVSSMSTSNTPEDNVTYVVEGYSTKNKDVRAFSNMDQVGKKNAEETKKTMLTMPDIDSVVVKRK